MDTDGSGSSLPSVHSGSFFFDLLDLFCLTQPGFDLTFAKCLFEQRIILILVPEDPVFFPQMSVFLFQKLIFLGLMHTLFALEDRYGLTIEKRDGETLLRFDPRKGIDALEMSQMVSAWASVAEEYSAGEINKEDYDMWRYNYPKYDNTQFWAKVPSQELSDALVKAFKDKW